MDTYSVGSKVVHPSYGAGTIVDILAKTIGDTTHDYFVVDTAIHSMQVMVPIHRASDLGLRSVRSVTDLRTELASSDVYDTEGTRVDLRTRQADMRNCLKSGSFGQVAEIVRCLCMMNRRRPLGTIDRQLFDQGKQFLAGELALALDADTGTAMEELETCLSATLDVHLSAEESS